MPRSMLAASVSLGSSTLTTWKRRASAASFFEVLLVFAPGGGGDGAQFAARQRRLEQVGRIVLAGLPARADHGVGFVDEQDDGRGALLDLVDHAFQAVLELALDAGAGLQQAHVQRAQRHAGQRRRHVAGHDAQRQAFDHRGLADAGLAGQDGVVLAPPRQDVDHLPDLGIAADHRVDPAFAGALGQVGGVLVQRRRLGQRGRGRCGLALNGVVAQRHRLAGLFRAGRQGREIVLQLFQPERLEQARAAPRQRRQIRLGQQRQQQVAGTDAGRLRVQRGDQPGMLEQARQVRRKHRGAGIAVLEAADLGVQVGLQHRGLDAAAARHDAEIAGGLFQQRQEQVFQVHLVVALRHAQAGGALGGLAAGLVQFPDQGFQGSGHVLGCLVLSGWCAVRSWRRRDPTPTVRCKERNSSPGARRRPRRRRPARCRRRPPWPSPAAPRIRS